MNPLTDAEIEALPTPTNVEIYEHHQAGGDVWMEWSGSAVLGRGREQPVVRWAVNPCGCYGPQWVDGRGVFAAEGYRLIPLDLYNRSEGWLPQSPGGLKGSPGSSEVAPGS